MVNAVRRTGMTIPSDNSAYPGRAHLLRHQHQDAANLADRSCFPDAFSSWSTKFVLAHVPHPPVALLPKPFLF
jgi:hypothetical protein